MSDQASVDATQTGVSATTGGASTEGPSLGGWMVSFGVVGLIVGVFMAGMNVGKSTPTPTRAVLQYSRMWEVCSAS